MAGAIDLDQALSFAIEVARNAGRMILEAFTSSHEAKGIEFKGSVDLVTQVDKDVERLVFDAIRAAYPEHLLLGEESAASSGVQADLSDLPTWVVDPIDGTTNFIHGQPFSAVSIALVVERQSVLGVVFNPMVDELFTAVRGKGAFLNGKPIHVAAAPSLEQAVVSTNVGYIRAADGIEFMLENIRRILKQNVRSMRMQGSSALELCSVAMGRLDAFYEFGIQAWDIAAAVVILHEAGGLAVDPAAFNGQPNPNPPPINLLGRVVLGANPTLVHIIGPLLMLPPAGVIKQ